MAVPNILPRNELEKKVNELSKDFQFIDAHLELPNNENTESIIDYLRDHFYIDEALFKSTGCTFGPDMRELWIKRLREPLSLILVSNKTGEVIGVCTMNVITRDLECFRSVSFHSSHPLQLIIQGYEAMDVFDSYGIDTALRLITLGVHKSYRGQGLSTKLMEAALIYAKDVGLNPVYVCAEASSKISQHIFDKFGFENCHTIKFSDCDGFVFKDVGKNDSVKFYAKLL